MLSPQHPTDADTHLTLLSISHGDRVTIRDREGRYSFKYSARVGEQFHRTDGAKLDLRLLAIERKTNRVFLQLEVRNYH